jgi:hypothetical protein
VHGPNGLLTSPISLKFRNPLEIDVDCLPFSSFSSSVLGFQLSALSFRLSAFSFQLQNADG